MKDINSRTLSALRALLAEVRPENLEDEAAFEWAGHIQYVIEQVGLGLMSHNDAEKSLGVKLSHRFEHECPDCASFYDDTDLEDTGNYDEEFSDLGLPESEGGGF